MSRGSIRYYFFAALVLLSGSILVFLGVTQASFWSEYTCFGGFFSCPNSPFDLIFLVLGTEFVYLAYPIAKMRSGDGEGSLIWDKKISGVSLIISGAVLTILSLVALIYYAPGFECANVPGCPPSIFSLAYADYWVPTFSGIVLILMGAILLVLNARKQKEILEVQKANEALHT